MSANLRLEKANGEQCLDEECEGEITEGKNLRKKTKGTKNKEIKQGNYAERKKDNGNRNK